jgi:hypothetical protein
MLVVHYAVFQIRYQLSMQSNIHVHWQFNILVMNRYAHIFALNSCEGIYIVIALCIEEDINRVHTAVAKKYHFKFDIQRTMHNDIFL